MHDGYTTKGCTELRLSAHPHDPSLTNTSSLQQTELFYWSALTGDISLLVHDTASQNMTQIQLK
jgi:hypothetical protein